MVGYHRVFSSATPACAFLVNSIILVAISMATSNTRPSVSRIFVDAFKSSLPRKTKTTTTTYRSGYPTTTTTTAWNNHHVWGQQKRRTISNSIGSRNYLNLWTTTKPTATTTRLYQTPGYNPDNDRFIEKPGRPTNVTSIPVTTPTGAPASGSTSSTATTYANGTYQPQNRVADNMPLPPPPSVQGDQPTMSAPQQQRQYSTTTSSASSSSNAVSSQLQYLEEQKPKNTNFDVSSVLAINPTEIEIVTVNPSDKEGTLLNKENDNGASSSEKNIVSSEAIRQLPFVSMFRGSANYIANHRNTLAVYHIPGGLLDLPDPSVFRDLMNDVALTWLLGMKVVLVVGCRYQIEKRVSDLDDNGGVSHGLRVTDENTLRVVKEEAGYVRFEVERQLARSLRIQGAGASSSTSAGYDGNVVSGNFYSAQPFGVLDGVDYMYTGFVRRVEVEKIRKLHDNRDICLLTTLGVSPSGEVFNVNSESLAASVAGALQASKVVYFTEQEMEIRHIPSGNKIQGLRLSDGRNLLKRFGVNVHKKGYVTTATTIDSDNEGNTNTVADLDKPGLNMLLKIGYSVQALEQGVKRAHIISPKHGALLQELYTRDGSGTLISGDLYEGIRRATVNDVSGIYDLISPLIRAGTLIDRPRAKLEKDIEKYHVFTRDDAIVACGELNVFEHGYAEIGCLVVSQKYRSRGRGDAMLGYLERMCVMNGCTNVFVLSTQTMEWFVERGFELVEVDKLPPSRQATYNHARKSKIYMKKIESTRDLDASELWWNR